MLRRFKYYYLLLLTMIFVAADVVAEAAYIGSKECAVCHRDETADWEKSSHARAFELLMPHKRRGAKKRAGLDPERDYTADPYCLGCHTTGYGKRGGYLNSAATPELAGIGCEMCHGSGGQYSELHKNNTGRFTQEQARAAGQTYGSIDPTVCARCHGETAGGPFTPAIDKKYRFKLEQRLKQIRAYHRYYSDKFVER